MVEKRKAKRRRRTAAAMQDLFAAVFQQVCLSTLLALSQTRHSVNPLLVTHLTWKAETGADASFKFLSAPIFVLLCSLAQHRFYKICNFCSENNGAPLMLAEKKSYMDLDLKRNAEYWRIPVSLPMVVFQLRYRF